MHTFSITTTSPESTQKLAASLARQSKPPCVLALQGDLGSGKTTFVTGFVHALSKDENIRVQSPTYALARTYQTDPPVHHIDLYRLTDEGEIFDLGIEELCHDEGAFCLIEWPHPALRLDPNNTIWIHFPSNADENRTITLRAAGTLGQKLELPLRDFV